MKTHLASALTLLRLTSFSTYQSLCWHLTSTATSAPDDVRHPVHAHSTSLCPGAKHTMAACLLRGGRGPASGIGHVGPEWMKEHVVWVGCSFRKWQPYWLGCSFIFKWTSCISSVLKKKSYYNLYLFCFLICYPAQPVARTDMME